MQIVAVRLLPRQHATNQTEGMMEASVVFSALISQTFRSELLETKQKLFSVLACMSLYVHIDTWVFTM